MGRLRAKLTGNRFPFPAEPMRETKAYQASAEQCQTGWLGDAVGFENGTGLSRRYPGLAVPAPLAQESRYVSSDRERADAQVWCCRVWSAW